MLQKKKEYLYVKLSIIRWFKWSYNYFLISTTVPGGTLILPVLFSVLRLTSAFWSRAVTGKSSLPGVLCWEKYDVTSYDFFFLTLGS